MSFSITHITPSRIDVLYDGEGYSVHGEALDKSLGGLDYVINAGDFHYSDDAREFEPIPAAVRLAVIEQLKAELWRRGWAFNVDESKPDVGGASRAMIRWRDELK